MFSPATRKKSKYSSSLKDRNAGQQKTLSFDSSPITPVADNRTSINDISIPNRPKTGTPAPWLSRPSVLARIPPTKISEKLDNRDPAEPVYVGEFPQAVHDEQANVLRKSVPGEACIAGGMDKETAFSWMICGSKLFVWSYLSPAASKKCVILDLPSDIFGISGKKAYLGDTWLLCLINWDNVHHSSSMLTQLNSGGVVLCNQKSRAIVYWPDIFSEKEAIPVISLASPEELGKSFPRQLHSDDRRDNLSAEPGSFNSLIASAIPSNYHACVALATSSNGELWQFICSPAGILRQNVCDVFLKSFSDYSQTSGSKGYPKSLIWRFPSASIQESNRQFFLLTDLEIQCFNIQLSANPTLSKIWSHEIIGTDNDLGIKKDLAGQKRIWPLDIKIDERGKEITILVAIFCKDRLSSSSYTQYSLLTMQYKSGFDETTTNFTHGRVLEKKSPMQVVIPKARVEEEDFLFSMRLRIGGKPSGSAVILSGDGTATVSYFWRNSTRLYQFDLPYDAGKVIDASVFPSTDDAEEGAWVVLTEKAGVWAIPEKAVLYGGVEPPERSLSRKGSSNERSPGEEKKNLLIAANVSGRSGVDSQDIASKQRAGFTGVVGRNAQDEEAEALLNRLFHDFLLSGLVDGSLEKLKNVRAFERDGETNAFARASKSIVDSLAKHWTTTRGAEIVSLAVVSNQLVEKQQKHEKFLQFLALSKCHEELCMKQRHTLQIILEDGEKLTGMIQLRELQSLISQSRSFGVSSQHSSFNGEVSGSLWDLIQIVGERARRNAVLLMDRDNAEVFYSKISNLEEVFYCLDKHLDYILNVGHPLKIQVQRVSELSKACVTLLRSAMHYKNEHHMWYPPPDGLVPWYSQPVVRDGLWSVASFMIKILDDSSGIDLSSKSDICSHLEVLADVVLEAYVGAITAKIELGEEHKVLSDEYWRKRDALLDSLYQQIKVFVNARCQDLADEKDQKEVILRELSSNLLSVARRHEAYRTLWNICCDLNDSTLLKELMHESMGPRGGFSYFVFEQLYEIEQFPKLLRLGEEFPQELVTFLKNHSNLLWLHEIFLHQYSAASKTLHSLALAGDERLFSAVDEETKLDSRKTNLTLPERKRLLHLGKIAAVAGKDADYEARIERIDADLKILKSQEEILKLFPDDIEKQQTGLQLLHPWDLIRLCLKGQSQELLLRAFDVFSWTSSSFRKSNKSLLEECWRSAVDQDDWEKLYQFSIAEGWSDEDTIRVLQKTTLFLAARRCYGLESDMYEGTFAEVLPLRQETSELPSMKDSGSSVEAILRQHKDFSDAGKLMLTALMLGSAQVDVDGGDGPIPME